MPDLSAKSVKQDARLFLAAGPTNYMKLTLMYLAVFLGAHILSGLIAFTTGLMAANSGGLSGIGTRVVLESVAAVAAIAVTILTFFWRMGLSHCAIGLARQDPMEPQHLKEGFYRFFVILRLSLAQALVYMITVSLISSLSGSVLLLLPGSEFVLSVLESTPNGLDWAFLVFSVILSAVFLLPLFYGYRMCRYRVMDNELPRCAADHCPEPPDDEAQPLEAV